MVLLKILQFLVVIGALLFIYTQIIEPLFRRTTLFPFFRPGMVAKQKEFQRKLDLLQQAEADARLAKEIEVREANLIKQQQSTTTNHNEEVK
jgi:hypothetical protein